MDKNVVEYVVRMLEWYFGFWQGIGEVIICYDDFIVLIYGEIVCVNYFVLMWVYKLVVKYDLLVLLYSNIILMLVDDLVYFFELEDVLK